MKYTGSMKMIVSPVANHTNVRDVHVANHGLDPGVEKCEKTVRGSEAAHKILSHGECADPQAGRKRPRGFL